MERVPTGIPGLDELIEGGFPRGRTILVSGACGTGKTIFSMQYIYKGAEEYEEPGIFVALDERPKTIREDALRFGWDVKEYEEEGLIRIIDASVARIGIPSEEEYYISDSGYDIDRLLVEIVRNAKEIRARRAVVDSIPALGFAISQEYEVRKAVLKLSYILTRIGLTTVITSEIPEGSRQFSKYGVEEYVADGVIVLRFLDTGAGRSMRTLHIRKMRGTKHSEHIHPMEITADRGIVVHSVDEI